MNEPVENLFGITGGELNLEEQERFNEVIDKVDDVVWEVITSINQKMGFDIDFTQVEHTPIVLSVRDSIIDELVLEKYNEIRTSITDIFMDLMIEFREQHNITDIGIMKIVINEYIGDSAFYMLNLFDIFEKYSNKTVKFINIENNILNRNYSISDRYQVWDLDNGEILIIDTFN